MERFATGAWLDRRIVRLAAGAVLAGTLASIAAGFLGRTGAYGTLDSLGRPLGTDFTLIWSAGRLVLEGDAASVYDWALLEKAEHAAHASDAIGFYGWHYPPLFLLVAAIVAPLPYLVSLVLWQLATLSAALAAVWRILPRPDALLVALGAPAAFVCLAHGQNAFLSAALFGGGLLLLERRPVLAGILFGCLAYKPHFGLVLPVALACGGYWRTIAAAAATAVALSLTTVALFGTAPWAAFLATAELTRRVVLEEGGTGWYKIQSAFSYVRMVGGSVALAYAVQGLVTLGVVAATAWLWRGGAPFRLRAGALVLAALLATPYLLDYDLVLLGLAIAFLAAHGLEHGFRRWEATALAVAWFAPVATRHLAYFCNIPAGLLATAILFLLVVGRAVEGDTARDAALAPA